MPITVTITKTLDDSWITDAQAATIPDSEIVELVTEDLYDFVNGACVEVERSGDAQPASRVETPILDPPTQPSDSTRSGDPFYDQFD